MMSTLTRAVTFRSLADQLDDAEYNRMISRLFRGCPRKSVLTWLFEQFVDSVDGSIEQQVMNNAIRDSSNIIQSRVHNECEIKPLKLGYKTVAESLSGDLYREIASYLVDKKYFEFSKTNRAIYVRCNSPTSLQYLDLINVQNYASIDLRKYPQLRHLKIDLTRFNELNLPSDGTTVCNHLTHLTLHGGRKEYFNIDGFLDCTCFSFAGLTTLVLKQFGSVLRTFGSQTLVASHRFNTRTFRKLLSKFPMIDYFALRSVYCRSTEIDNQDIKSLLPKLRGIAFGNPSKRSTTQFIQIYGDRLESLEIWDPADTIPSGVSFKQLLDLCVHLKNPEMLSTKTVLKLAEKLQIIEISEDTMGADAIRNNKQWASVMSEIVSKQKSLRYLRVQTDTSNLVHVADGLESGLYATHQSTCDLLIKIKFHTDSERLEARKKIIYILRIVDKLSQSKRRNFKLLCTGIYYDVNWRREVRDFRRNHEEKYTMNFNRWALSISNKDCKILGNSSPSHWRCLHKLTE